MANNKDETPYVAINTLTNAILGRYPTLFEGNYAHKGEPVEVYYRPRKRRAKGRTFP